jgi:hypothetical protein
MVPRCKQRGQRERAVFFQMSETGRDSKSIAAASLQFRRVSSK